jgi:plastocyanin
VADPRSGQLIAARRQGTTWTSEVVAKDVAGGASLAIAGDVASIAFYTASGVSVATGRFGAWSVEEVAPVKEGTPSPSPSPSGGPAGSPSPSPAAKPIETEPTTGVAVDDEGTTWLGWEDGDGIHLASREGGDAFKEVELLDTSGGVNPSVAVAADGSSVYLAWFDPEKADLRVGIYAEISGLLIAAPSPTPTVAVTGPAGCGEDKKPVLDIIAKGIAFDPRCLVAPAGESFTVTFENQDAGISHNFEILVAKGGEVIAGTEVKPGTFTDELKVDPQEEGNYYFQCFVHPDAMNGTLAVVTAGKGK